MPSPIDLGPKPRLGYANSIVQRAAERRDDLGFLASLDRDPRCGAYVISGENVVLRKDGGSVDPLFAPGDARALAAATETIFLGFVDGCGRLGIGIDGTGFEALKARADLLVTDLRSIAVQGLVQPDHLPALAEAKALLNWHLRHRFCSNCGAATRVLNGGWRRDCPQCKAQHFPRTDPVVIMLTIDGERCLLGSAARFVPNSWSCLAGFVEPGETIEEAVRRETVEETGIVCGHVRYFQSQPWPFPSSLMIGCHAQALSREIVVDRNELEDARWFGREEAALMLARKHPQGLITPPPVAIAHHIIRAWVEEGTAVLA
jgi:NAD+ diphosphatase